MIRRRITPSEQAALAGTPDAGASLTDVVGTVSERDAHHVVVTTRRGDVRVAHADIVAAKRIPPTPGRRGTPHRAIGVSALEELMVEGWAPETRAWMGRWLLRESGGYTGRANSCLVLGDPDRPVPSALQATAAWYLERNAAPLIAVPLAPDHEPGSDPLVVEAEQLGWRWFQPTRVMTAATTGVIAVGATPPPGITLAEGDVVDDAWWSLAEARMRAAEESARGVLQRSPEQVFLTASRQGEAVARARIAFAHAWGGVFAVATRDEARRQGLGRSIVTACAQAAERRGVASLYLQVSADNDAAMSLYESLGFTTHHTYVHLRRD